MYHSTTQIVPDHTNHTPYKFTHKLTVTAVGGEAVIGKVPRKVAEYWNSLDRARLAYILIDKKHNISRTLGGRVIDPTFTAKRWTDVCDKVDLDDPALEWDPTYAVVDKDENVSV